VTSNFFFFFFCHTPSFQKLNGFSNSGNSIHHGFDLEQKTKKEIENAKDSRERRRESETR